MCLLFGELDEFFDKHNPLNIKISGDRDHILTKLDGKTYTHGIIQHMV